MAFKLAEKNNIVYYNILKFMETDLVEVGFSTRRGGVSKPPYESLNLGLHVGDSAEDVIQNRDLFALLFGADYKELVAAQQVHGTNIHLVSEKDKGKGSLDYSTALKGTDALITKEKGIPLTTYYADCVPIFILDKVTPAIGLAHAGWKGTLARIAGKTIEKMTEEFGTRPENCLAAIGPSIGPCCYEVDDYILKQLEEQHFEHALYTKEIGEGKWLLDLWKLNYDILLEAGVRINNIITGNICTKCNRKTFFSYRAEAGKTGRMSAFLMLK